MEKQKKVIDASVAAKLFLNEKNSEIAKAIRDKHVNNEIEIIVPELVFLEVANALRWKNEKSEFMTRITETLFGLNFYIVNITQPLLKKSIENSLRYGITIYDALYISIAQFHGCEFITADEELYKVPNVIPLEKFS